ncbi:class I SAM-dependent methyltransferase [Paludisphaera rhizosphaerae]|uniref:class I SAM-dependent methyltransferase n=1 Tax=Paludisphaera rhizosphaerae TaxID=2711216 RepID=UPI0013ED6749|nr:class I SAM-dependent methyltransferase [Paludisphaera rhizosphaerae]
MDWKLGMTSATLVMFVAGAWAQEPSKGKVDPKINEQFQKKENVDRFIKSFEGHDREVSTKRDAIVAALQLKPGMAVADIGAGSGLFTRLMAEKVGAEGAVYAVDISKDFLKHIDAQSAKLGQRQVKTVLGSQNGTNLEPESVDLVFLSDVYHHFEDHQQMLASIKKTLRPGGTLIVIEFDRKEGKSSEFILKHVRAGQADFRKEIEAAGFQSADGPKPELKENFFARFRKPAE